MNLDSFVTKQLNTRPLRAFSVVYRQKKFSMFRIILSQGASAPSQTIMFFIGLFAFNMVEAQTDNEGLSSRSFWKKQPSLEDVMIQVDLGDDPSALGPYDFDPLSWALIEEASPEILDYLLSFEGNTVNKLTHDARTYVFWAAYRNNQAFMKKLKGMGADFGIVDEHGYSLLNFAAVTGQTDAVLYDLIINEGAKPDQEVNYDGANALLLVSSHLKDMALVEYFGQFGLEMNDTDSDGSNGFLYACKGGNIEFLNLLIEQGMSSQFQNSKGQNAAHFAAMGTRGNNPKIEVFEFLKEQGVELDYCDEKGTTALMILCQKRNDNGPTLQYMIGESSDLHVRDSDGKTAMHHALERGSVDCIETLMNSGWSMEGAKFKTSTLVHSLAEGYSSKSHDVFDEKMALLRSVGISARQLLKEGETWFHVGARSQSMEMLKFAAVLGLDVNHADDEGCTALHEACMTAQDIELLKWLVSIGASKDVLTLFEETPFDLASENEMLAEEDLQFLKTGP